MNIQVSDIEKKASEELFQSITSPCENSQECIAELLKFRGFLIENKKGKYYLSDNSDPWDSRDLDELLKKCGLGAVVSRRKDLTREIYFSDAVDTGEGIEKLWSIFTEGRVNGSEAFCETVKGWQHFASRDCGSKLATGILEPFVARYIKAVSACGVFTACSCDGNHPGRSKIIVELNGRWSKAWHEVLVKYVLGERFKLAWDAEYSKIRFTPGNKFKTYYTLNRAAAYLYENRIRLRGIKKEAFKGRTAGYFRHTPAEEIEADFIAKATALVREMTEL